MPARSSRAVKQNQNGKEPGGKSRPIWKGSLQFGLVNIPVSLYSGEAKKELKFRLLDRRNLSPIRYQRVNEKTGQEVPWDEVVKGYEYEDGEYVLLGDEDFRGANVEATQTIEITDFVDAAEISPVYYDKPYYLEPLKNARKGYALLQEVLRRTGKVGIAKVVIRSRQYLAAVIARDPVLILNLLRFAHDLRDPSVFDIPEENLRQLKIGEKEIKMAERLVEAMVDKWAPEKYREEYREDLLKLIDKKVKDGKTKVIEERGREAERPRKGEIVNIMDLLKRSVEQAHKSDEPRKRKAG